MMHLLFKLRLILLLSIFSICVFGQPTIYPSSSGIVDVTKAPYFVDNSGVNDASAGINQALEDFNDAHTIIYLPAGTYRVTDSIRWGSPAGCDVSGTFTCHRYTILAGAGPENTTILLDDNDPDYQDVSNPEIMIWTQTSAAMSFENSIRNLTVNTGNGNPGAIALGFEANNQGGVFNVNIKSGDGAGQIGLHLGTGDQAGPCLIKNVTVEGFDTGIQTFANQNSLCFEGINLIDQNVLGIFNRQQSITIKDLYSENEVPVINNNKDGGSIVTLINSTLVGTGSASTTAGILNFNLNPFFVRNVNVTGYQYGIQQLQNGFTLQTIDPGYIDEYTTKEPVSVCNNIKKSLNMPIVEAPIIIYEDTSNWVSITDAPYNAEIDNGFLGQGSSQDDTEAIQSAFNSGASTILIPGPGGQFPNRFIAYDTIDIPASVKHIIGAKGKVSGNLVLKILPGTDTLIIEDFSEIGSFIHASSRVLYIKNSGIRTYRSLANGTSGDVFIEDVVGGPYYFKNQNVWARQMNTEKDQINIVNDGGNLWILGHKTEKKGTATQSINGAKTEILGSLFYTTTAENNPASPIHIVDESSFSIAGFKELNYINDAYDIKVREIRNGQTEDYTLGNVSMRADLFVAYVDNSNPNMAPEVDAGEDHILLLPEDTLQIDAVFNDDGLPNEVCFAAVLWSQIKGPITAQIMTPSSASTTFQFLESGEYEFELSVSDGALTTRDTIQILVFDHFSSTFDHSQDGMASGYGADANLRGWSNALKNYGASEGFGPRFYNIFPAKSIFRIDVSVFDSVVAENCLLELELSTTNSGIIEDWEYNIFGLNDGHVGEDWIEGMGDGDVDTTGGVNYDNAPGFSDEFGGVYDPADTTSAGVNHNDAVFLGTIKTRDGVREKVNLYSEALTNFINADTSGSVTFLMTRASFDINTITFASKEHPSFDPPRLYFDFDYCPQNAVTYVDASATGAGTGDSWTDAFTSLNEVFNNDCLTAIDTIKIAQGTYLFTLNPTQPTLVNTIVIEGGYAPGGLIQNVDIYPTKIGPVGVPNQAVSIVDKLGNFVKFDQIELLSNLEVIIE